MFGPKDNPMGGNVCVCVRVCVFTCIWLFTTPWTIAYQDALESSMDDGCPWDHPNKNIGMGCHFLFQGIFPTQWSNPSLLHHSRVLYHWATTEGRMLIVIAQMKDLEALRLSVLTRSQLSDWTTATRGHKAVEPGPGEGHRLLTLRSFLKIKRLRKLSPLLLIPHNSLQWKIAQPKFLYFFST